MSKIAVVIGATGHQGGAVVSSLLADPTFKVRGITRNPQSPKAQALTAKGVEVVAADLTDEESLVRAFDGAYAIFAVTDFLEPFIKFGPEKAKEIEYQHGVNLARAASRTSTLEHYIWSTLPDSRTISEGKIVVPHFDAKQRVDDFIRKDAALFKKTVFLFVTFYATNLLYPMFTPIYSKPAGKYITFQPVVGSTQIASLGPLSNVGLAAHTIITTPYPLPESAKSGPTPARYVLIVAEYLEFEDYFKLWAKTVPGATATGEKDVNLDFLKISRNEYEKLVWNAEMSPMLQYWELVGAASWTTVQEGDVLVELKDMLKGTDKEVRGTEAAFKEIDWTSVL
ncbi:hypothetical protein AJ80_02818 [Polytolypa hystricis UAMH7299]|uniref:NmrA-like domain-containing protein n=1 Tax=Polytolypa hystricis (strain UAMH7299) TaxID=1447883 RepID=A0A2B7YP12_POLH7|nr:hypothetical protein AJ80_02818 [Polytolypa hystricis UAMH7299]